MKVALLMGPRRIEIQDVELPELLPGEVLVHVKAAGICGTDIDAYKGHQPRGWTITYPFRMGHEFSAVVSKVGSDVQDFEVGDHVVVDGRLPCGKCSQCRSGNVNACMNGGYISGGFMEYSIFPEKCLVRVPESIPFEHAAFAEPLSCCLYGNRKLDVNPGDTAVIIGDGAIGILHAQIMRLRGARTVLVGLIEKRLSIAKDLGVDYVINANEEDATAKIMEITSGCGANQVVCAVGAEAVLQQALEVSARFGQVLYFAANLKDRISLEMDLIHYKELSMIGSYDSTTEYFEQAIRLLEQGKVEVGSLITHKVPMANIAEGFEAAEQMLGLKVILTNEW